MWRLLLAVTPALAADAAVQVTAQAPGVAMTADAISWPVAVVLVAVVLSRWRPGPIELVVHVDHQETRQPRQ